MSAHCKHALNVCSTLLWQHNIYFTYSTCWKDKKTTPSQNFRPFMKTIKHTKLGSLILEYLVQSLLAAKLQTNRTGLCVPFTSCVCVCAHSQVYTSKLLSKCFFGHILYPYYLCGYFHPFPCVSLCYFFEVCVFFYITVISALSFSVSCFCLPSSERKTPGEHHSRFLLDVHKPQWSAGQEIKTDTEALRHQSVNLLGLWTRPPLSVCSPHMTGLSPIGRLIFKSSITQ